MNELSEKFAATPGHPFSNYLIAPRKISGLRMEITQMNRDLAHIKEQIRYKQADEREDDRRLNLKQNNVKKLKQKLLKYQLQLQAAAELNKSLKASQKTLKKSAMELCPPKGSSSQREEQCQRKKTHHSSTKCTGGLFQFTVPL